MVRQTLLVSFALTMEIVVLICTVNMLLFSTPALVYAPMDQVIPMGSMFLVVTILIANQKKESVVSAEILQK